MKTFLKPLTSEEEKYYLQEYKRGSQEAKNVLIERNLRLVAHIVKKYQGVEEELDDLISIGTIGLIKAIHTFNQEKSNRLSTYAARCIDNELLMLLRSKKKTSKDISLYEPIGTDREGNEINLLDVIENEPVDVVKNYSLKQDIRKLYYLLGFVLTRREAEVLKLRFGLFQKKKKCLYQKENCDTIIESENNSCFPVQLLNLRCTSSGSSAIFSNFKFI